MTYAELMEAGVSAQLLCRILMDERRRVEYALIQHDKPGQRETTKSLVHLSFDLVNLYAELEVITRERPSDTATKYDDWFYADQNSMTETECHDKLIDFYQMGMRQHKLLRVLIAGLKELDEEPKVLIFLTEHIHLSLIYLRFDVRTLTGQDF